MHIRSGGSRLVQWVRSLSPLHACKRNDTEDAAAAAADQKTDDVHHNKSDESKQIHKRIATVTAAIIPTIVVPKHPDTANDDPNEQEDWEEGLEAAATSVGIVWPTLLLAFSLLLAENTLDDVDDGLHKAHNSKHN